MVLQGQMSASDGSNNGVTYFVLHAKFALTLCRATELTRVAEHVIQSNFRSTHKLFIANLTVDDSTSPLVQTTDNSA
jgi:hypothetical protein